VRYKMKISEMQSLMSIKLCISDIKDGY